MHNDGTQQLAMNVIYECDMSHMMKGGQQRLGDVPDSSGLLSGVFAWDKPTKDWSFAGINRCLKPYKEWLIIFRESSRPSELGFEQTLIHN